jgi:hypothetical protein
VSTDKTYLINKKSLAPHLASIAPDMANGDGYDVQVTKPPSGATVSLANPPPPPSAAGAGNTTADEAAAMSPAASPGSHQYGRRMLREAAAGEAQLLLPGPFGTSGPGGVTRRLSQVAVTPGYDELDTFRWV